MPFGPSPLLQLALADTNSICLRCARKLARSSLQPRRTISISSPVKQTVTGSARAQDLDSRYFWGNDFRSAKAERYSEARKSWQSLKAQGTGRIRSEKATSTEPPPAVPTPPTSSSIPANTAVADTPPVPRRRARLKGENGNDPSASDSSVTQLPPDASATLSALASSSKGLRRRLATYLALTKPRLAFLVVLTTTASYSLYPVPSLLSASATHTPSLSTLTLLFLTTGTFSTIASANTLNMLFEPAHDAKMSRTRNRPLVRGLIKPRSAVLFAVATAIAGAGILYYGVNPTTAALGTGNIVLYAFIYTPMKRLSIINTWVGAVVGAIPPLMGWCAAGGQYATFSSSSPTFGEEFSTLLFTPQATGGWLLASLLFAWQFPHFNALSHPIRTEYLNAGYRMMVSYYPRLNARVALRYSVVMFPICVGLSYYGVTDRGFVLTSSAVNAWMVREAWRFWRSGGGEGALAAKSARGLFWASVWHLPIVLVLALVHKKGLWEGVWNGVFGDGEVDEEGEWEYEDE